MKTTDIPQDQPKTTEEIVSEVLKLVEAGKMTTDKGNVEIFRRRGVVLATARMPRQLGKALTQGVKDGRLGKLPKSKDAPAVYYHPDKLAEALARRAAYRLEGLEALAKVVC